VLDRIVSRHRRLLNGRASLLECLLDVHDPRAGQAGHWLVRRPFGLLAFHVLVRIAGRLEVDISLIGVWASLRHLGHLDCVHYGHICWLEGKRKSFLCVHHIDIIADLSGMFHRHCMLKFCANSLYLPGISGLAHGKWKSGKRK